MRVINFASGEWNRKEFRYVYSPKYPAITKMYQEENCIVNDGDMKKNEFDYTSILSESKYTRGVKIETRCSFEDYGAPLIVLSDDIIKGKDGKWYYGRHYEIVMFEGGINVWYLDLNPDVMKIENLMRLKFSVSAREIHTLKVQVLDDAFNISMGEQQVCLSVKGLPTEFRVGLTACEGINRFYSLSIE